MPRKSSAKPGPKAIPAPEVKDPAPEVTEAPVAASFEADDEGEGRGAALKLPALVQRVAESTGGKKKDIKDIVEATLAALGSALAKGEELNLPGIGKVRVAKSVDKDGRSMMTLKVRGAGAGKKKVGAEPLADADEAV